MLNAAWSEICWALIDVTSGLEGVGDERRPEAAEGRHHPREDRLGGREGRERVEIEGRAEIAAHVVDDRRVARLDADSSGRRLDPDFPPAKTR